MRKEKNTFFKRKTSEQEKHAKQVKNPLFGFQAKRFALQFLSFRFGTENEKWSQKLGSGSTLILKLGNFSILPQSRAAFRLKSDFLFSFF
jgi:hypothetical protein